MLVAVRTVAPACFCRSRNPSVEDDEIRLIDHPGITVQVGEYYVVVSWTDSFGCIEYIDNPPNVAVAVREAIAKQAVDKVSYEELSQGLIKLLGASKIRIERWKNSASAAEVLYGLCDQICKSKITNFVDVIKFIINRSKE